MGHVQKLAFTLNASFPLAQSASGPVHKSSNLEFWLAIAGMVLLVTIGGAFIFWARRWARGPVPISKPGFTLEDLREMFERGEISQREYDTARDVMLHRARTAARHERDRRGGTDWSGPESGKKKPPKPGR